MRIFVCVAEKPSHQRGVRQTPQGCQKGTTQAQAFEEEEEQEVKDLSLIHISEPTRLA